MIRLLAAAAVLSLVGCPAPAPTPPASPAVVVTPPPPPAPAPPPPAAEGLVPPEPTLRLPKNFVPASYEAQLSIDPAKPAFGGAIMITGEIKEKTSVIWLHGRNLKVTRAAAAHEDPFAVPQPPHSDIAVTPHGTDLLELRVTPALDPGTWVVALEYTGQIEQQSPDGAFAETVGKDRYVYTQFEAVAARRVFPCVDEPDTKVPWQLTIDAPKGALAVSNTPVEKTTKLADGGTRTQFARTKPLPSYLIAFGVGPFDVVDGGTTKRGVPVRILTMKGRAADGAWAAKTTARIIDLLEEWFAIPYPYEKADMLAVPATRFGAMENAGLVTYAEEIILVDAQNASWSDKYDYVDTAAHELAHQWFGDYVTTAWWDDIWLNEGFANWMERKITTKFEPAWHDELGDVSMRDQALDADSLVTARKIRQPIEKVDDIVNAFDGITYDKGASVLAMFESYVGPDVFQKGVRGYLQARAYGNATSADFVAAVSAAAGKDVAPAFASFLDQAGAPEITATVACGKGGARLELSQQRYLAPGSPAPAIASTPWLVPVCVAYERAGKRAEQCTLLDKAAASVPLETHTCPRWLMPNVNGRGYYRAKLTNAQVIALRDEGWPQLSWAERLVLDFDVATLVHSRNRADKLPLALALSFVPRLLAGGDRFTIGYAVGLPTGLDRLVAADQRPKYEAWLRTMFGPGAAKVGVVPKDADDLDAESTRGELFGAVAWLGRDPELVKQAVELAARWRDLPASMRGAILSVAADANPELYAQLLAGVKSEKDRARRDEMIVALAATRDPKRLEQTLAQVLLDPAIEPRDYLDLLFAPTTDATRRTAEEFLRAHAADLMKRLPHDDGLFSASRLANVVTNACDPARRDEIADYVTKTFASVTGGERNVKQAIERMDHCIARRQLLEPEVRAWLGGVKIAKPKDKPKK